MSRPQKVALQRCFLFGSVPRGVEDAAPYIRKLRFFDTLRSVRSPWWLFFAAHDLRPAAAGAVLGDDDLLVDTLLQL